jgi:multicomponent K+:H+ antiporter subunit F
MILAALILILASIAASLWRLRRAGEPADRIIALDVISFQAVGALIGFSLLDNSPLALEAALVIALVGFLTTLVLSRLLVPLPPSDPS